jgi:hypothetical protein
MPENSTQPIGPTPEKTGFPPERQNNQISPPDYAVNRDERQRLNPH